MRLGLHTGVWTSAVGLGTAGAGGVAVAPAWSAAWIIGWISIVAGVALFLWGVKINDRHWWASRKPRARRLSLNEVARRVAYESAWGINFELGSFEYVARYAGDPWKLLMLEICRPLTLGDIKAWGVKIERHKDAEHGPTEIPKEYWIRGDFAPELMLTEPSISTAGGGDGAPTYRDVQLDRAGAEAIWPRAPWWRRRRSRFRTLYTEWRAKWDAEHQQHAAWLNRTAIPETLEAQDFAPAKPPPSASPPADSNSLSDAEIRGIETMLGDVGRGVNEGRELALRMMTSPASEPPPFLYKYVENRAETRRELIAKGRNVVYRWRRSDRSQPFEIFASQDRDYLDVQPQLGAEYQAERTGRTLHITEAGEDYRSAMLLHELDRLEREWGLV